MNSTYPKSAGIALALIVFALLLSQVAMILSPAQKNPSTMATEGMANYEKRFAEARKVLPRAGVIGYLSDPQDDQSVPPLLYKLRYNLMQYDLAPLVVADSTEPPLILGNFFSSDGMKKAMADRKLVVLHDVGNGVLILRREGS